MNEVRQPRIGFIYCGLPASGKTTTAEYGKRYTDGTMIETGDIIREMAVEQGYTDPSSKELAEVANDGREHVGNAFVEQRIINEINTNSRQVKFPLHVSGVRHIEAVAELREFFTTSGVIVVRAPFSERYERIRERDREGEGDFTEIDLLERDEFDLNELGTKTILESNAPDAVIQNNESLRELKQSVEREIDRYI